MRGRHAANDNRQAVGDRDLANIHGSTVRDILPNNQAARAAARPSPRRNLVTSTVNRCGRQRFTPNVSEFSGFERGGFPPRCCVAAHRGPRQWHAKSPERRASLEGQPFGTVAIRSLRAFLAATLESVLALVLALG